METYSIAELAADYVRLGGKDPKAQQIVEKVRKDTANPLLHTDASEANFSLIDQLAE